MKKVVQIKVIMDDIISDLDVGLYRTKNVDQYYIGNIVAKKLKYYGLNENANYKDKITKDICSMYGIKFVAKPRKTDAKTSKKPGGKTKGVEDITKYGKPSKKQQEQIDNMIDQYFEKTKKNKIAKPNTKYDHVCYRFLTFAGEIIYVGRAENLINRINSHAKKGHLSPLCYNRVDKVEFCTFDSEDDLDIAERYYISKYQPEYNVIFKDRKYFTIGELDNKQWQVYNAGARILKNM